MPQLNPAVWMPQIIWMVITFCLLWFLVHRLVLPRLSQVLDDREFRINDSLRKAEALKRDAEDAVAAYERMMADARSKARDTVRAVRERSAQQAAERHGQLTERLNKEIEAAEARIAQARDEALAGIRDIAVSISEATVEKLIGAKIDSRTLAAAVDHSLREAR